MSEAKRKDEIQGEIVHVYDGIEEADNALPTWWLLTFYGAIAFSVFYWLGYHTFEIADLPLAAYGNEMARRAESGGELTNDMLDALTSNTSEVSAGKALFEQHCAVCHGTRAEGQIGPNLTDDAWLHGGSPMAIFATIRDGVTENGAGMPNWGAPLGNTAVRKLTAYVLSVRNTNVPGKQAEGEPWAREAETP